MLNQKMLDEIDWKDTEEVFGEATHRIDIGVGILDEWVKRNKDDADDSLVQNKLGVVQNSLLILRSVSNILFAESERDE